MKWKNCNRRTIEKYKVVQLTDLIKHFKNLLEIVNNHGILNIRQDKRNRLIERDLTIVQRIFDILFSVYFQFRCLILIRISLGFSTCYHLSGFYFPKTATNKNLFACLYLYKEDVVWGRRKECKKKKNWMKLSHHETHRRRETIDGSRDVKFLTLKQVSKIIYFEHQARIQKILKLLIHKRNGKKVFYRDRWSSWELCALQHTHMYLLTV